MPIGVQRQRTKGWKMPPNTKSVTRPGIFGNPFKVTPEHDAATCVQDFKTWLKTGDVPERTPLGELGALWNRRKDVLKRIPELRGKNLACFCKIGAACHRDVLLALANKSYFS